MDDPNVLSLPSVTRSIMKEAIKTAKVVIKKKDLRIQELEDQIHVNIKKEVAGVDSKKKPSEYHQTHTTTAPVQDSKKKPATKRAVSQKKPREFLDIFSHPSHQPPHKYHQTHTTTAPVQDSKKKSATKRAVSQKKPREFLDIFSHPSHQPPHKKEKKIREKLGLENIEFALSQASLPESKADSATSASTTFSLGFWSYKLILSRWEIQGL
jgi:uncharacterized membrane protein